MRGKIMGYSDKIKTTTTVVTQVWVKDQWVNETMTETVTVEERSGD